MSEEVSKSDAPVAGAEDKAEKMLGLMRYWLFGTFMIVWAATFAYLSMFVGMGTAIAVGWPIWAITAVLCIIAYVGYSFYAKRQLK